MVGGESLGHEVAEQLERLAPFGMGNPGVRLLVPWARVCEVRPMGEADRHARFRLQSGSRSALGVAFGVNGELKAAELADPLDVSVKLELNEWNGAVEPRVVLGELYPGGSADAGEGAPVSDRRGVVAQARRRAPGPARRLAASADRRRRCTRIERRVVDRRGGSRVAAVAALASSGDSVLALCADAPAPPRAGRACRGTGPVRWRTGRDRLRAARRRRRSRSGGGWSFFFTWR